MWAVVEPVCTVLLGEEMGAHAHTWSSIFVSSGHVYLLLVQMELHVCVCIVCTYHSNGTIPFPSHPAGLPSWKGCRPLNVFNITPIVKAIKLFCWYWIISSYLSMFFNLPLSLPPYQTYLLQGLGFSDISHPESTSNLGREFVDSYSLFSFLYPVAYPQEDLLCYSMMVKLTVKSLVWDFVKDVLKI